jgi:hypothetical protein
MLYFPRSVLRPLRLTHSAWFPITLGVWQVLKNHGRSPLSPLSPLECAVPKHSKFCTILVQITPLDSALTDTLPVTPLECAVTKKGGYSGVQTGHIPDKVDRGPDCGTAGSVVSIQWPAGPASAVSTDAGPLSPARCLRSDGKARPSTVNACPVQPKSRFRHTWILATTHSTPGC